MLLVGVAVLYRCSMTVMELPLHSTVTPAYTGVLQL